MSTDKITPQREAALIAADELQKAYEAGLFNNSKNGVKTYFVEGHKVVIFWYCELRLAYCRVYDAIGSTELNLTEWHL